MDLYRTAATKALYANPPDWPSMIVWEQYLSPGDLFVDVGANIGTYSILAASLGASVIAVEPAADTAALLRENVALNEADISVIEAAAGATSGELRFSAGRDAVNRADPEGPLTVPMVTLDTIIGDRTVAGMKLDIEGYEIEALNGARRLLTDQRIGLLQLEWNGAADRAPIVEILGSCGYRLKRVLADGHLAGYQGEAAEDLFAVPEQPD